MKPSKAFAEIVDLLDDLARNYDGTVFSDTSDRNYRVTAIGTGTADSIMERLRTYKKTKLIYLIAEETDER